MAAYFEKPWKRVHGLSVNEAKDTSRNNFIDNLFTLKSVKELKKDKKNPVFRLTVDS